METNDNHTPPAEAPTPAPVETIPQPAPSLPPVETEDAAPLAPPPAARLVVEGVKSEREIELESQLAERDAKLQGEQKARRDAEFTAAEKEKQIQELKKIPAVQKPKAKNYFRPLIGLESDDRS